MVYESIDYRNDHAKNILKSLNLKKVYQPSDVQANSYPHSCTGGGGGGGSNSSLEFLICCSISKRFYLKWEAFDILNKMRYILWVVALLETCDITNNGRHLQFYQELEIRLKTARNGNFLEFYMKNNT